MPTGDRRGSALMIVLFIIMVVLALAPLMIDLGYLFATKSRVQSAADAASLAGALRLRDDKASRRDVNTMAIRFAKLNQVGDGEVLRPADVEIGEWDTVTNSFVRGTRNINAVRVTVRRGGRNSNNIPLFFAKIFGREAEDIQVSSIAAFDVSEDDEGNDVKGMPFIVN